ncbi:MAG TPA: hypothetical protein PK411_15755 [Mesotoga infera]|nr:hypothetical protein [Mesotoga infera]
MTEETRIAKYSTEIPPVEVPPPTLIINGKSALEVASDCEQAKGPRPRPLNYHRIRKDPEPDPDAETEPPHPKLHYRYNRNQPFFFSGYRVLVDCSSTGSGKTTRIARCLRKFKEAGVKRVVYVSRSPLNPPVTELLDYPVLVGRTPYGYTKDGLNYRERTAEEAGEDSPVADIPPNCENPIIREMEENDYYGYVGSYCKNICPHREDCTFREERKEARKVPFLRTSLQNYYPMPGDVVIFDERTTIQELEVVHVDEQDLKLLLADLVRPGGKVRTLIEKAWTESVAFPSIDEEPVPEVVSAPQGSSELDCVGQFYSDNDWDLVIVAIKSLIEGLEVIRKSRKLHFGPSALLAEVARSIRSLLRIEATALFSRLKVLDGLSFTSFADWKALGGAENSEEVLRILKESEMVRLFQDCLRFLRMDDNVSLSIVRGKLCLVRHNARWSSIVELLRTHTIKAIVLDASARRDDYENLFAGVEVFFTSLVEVC